MTIYRCAYCRRGNDHVGVCDGCGAPLPCSDEINLHDGSMISTGYQMTMTFRTDGMYSYPHDEGIHNRRWRNG